ncbi:MAG: hypothetical protein K2G69_07765 [Muribaculaceae bacterium]|nr:hypothetical protein [Muribaculaceae bacterium]
MEHVSRITPSRSRLSDKELAAKIRRERAERPSEFVKSTCGFSNSNGSYCVSSVNEVIAKWL